MSMNDRLTKENFKETLQELDKAATDHGKLEKDLTLPPVFQQAGPWIALAKQILQNAHTQLEKTDAKPVGQDLYQCSRICKTKSQVLGLVIDHVATTEAGGRAKRYAEAVAQDEERAVESLLDGILGAIVEAVKSGSLIADEHQKSELSNALKKLSDLAAKAPGGQGFHYSGVGDMFNNLGDGKVNVGKDKATLYIADTMHTAAQQQDGT